MRLREAGILVTTGTNLWFAEIGSCVPVIVVTGTKGKSTTASLLAHLARCHGLDARLAGNIGTALLPTLDEPLGDLFVVELSSYQIADLDAVPTAAVVLNLYREHTDWHLTEANYYRDKLRVVSRTDEVVAVLNARDPRLRRWAADRGNVRWFGDGRGAHVRDGQFVSRDGTVVADVDDLKLRGEHNALNVCAAVEALAVVGVAGHVGSALRAFTAPPHRLEEISDHHGRLWVNDSISTTPESTMAAVRSFSQRPLTLIVGGYDRDQRYDELAELLARRQAPVAVVALPVTGPRVLDRLAQLQNATGVVTRTARNLDEAVEIALPLTPRGGVVLLSPAAPSYGAYRNFEERGDHFRRLVAGR